MKARVTSTVTKPTQRKSNPRPRKYASASERQAAYRDRAPELCFRAEPKTVETLDRIAETIDRPRTELMLSMVKFALANHDWARFGLTHKPLPFGYGARDDETRKENPAMKTTTKRMPTPAQLAARERFAEMARSGAFKGVGGSRRKNPVGASMLPVESDEVKKGIAYADRRFRETGRHYLVTNEGHSALDVPGNRKTYKDMGLEVVYTTKGKRRTNPAATRRGNPVEEYTYSVDMEGVGKSGLFMTKAVFKTAQDAKQYARALAKSYPSRTIRVMSGGRWIKR